MKNGLLKNPRNFGNIEDLSQVDLIKNLEIELGA